MNVETKTLGEIALVRFANPPVNALSARTGLVPLLRAALEAAAQTAQAIVVAAEGRFFSAGADIAEFGDTPADDVRDLRELVEYVETIERPVVVALHGAALGGGLEFALAAHYRVASPETRLGFPEVTLGLLPGAGGTQRLPRLAGADAALDMILTGKIIIAADALGLGIIDEIASGDLVEAAVAAARKLAASAPRRASQIEISSANLAEAGSSPSQPVPRGCELAHRHIVESVRASARPFSEGLALEWRLFEELVLSEPSRGLRHAFLAERAAQRIVGQPKEVVPLNIRSAAVTGSGTMGAGIAIALLGAGFPVTLIDVQADALDRAAARIRGTFDAQVAKGRLGAAAAEAASHALNLSTDISAASDVDIVIEAVFEDVGVKREVLQRLDAVMRADAVLATNTSTLDIDMLAAFTSRPGRVVGMHFFSPANVMKLLEIVRGANTDPHILATAMEFAKRIGKIGVIAGVCDGFIGNRLFEEYLRQAYFLLDEGARPQQVDAALEAWGMAMGPLAVMDLAGQDIGYAIRQRRKIEQPEKPYSEIPDRIAEMGRYGQKTGAGFYLYPDGARRGVVDPEIDTLVRAYASEKGIGQREINYTEIIERCVYALVNEGAKTVGEGHAQRPGDVDVVYVNGYGFPAMRGGPMFFADRVGLPRVLQRMREFAAGRNGWAWEPAPLLVELAGSGRSFQSMNG